jgi:hypothetical protein
VQLGPAVPCPERPEGAPPEQPLSEEVTRSHGAP